MQLKRQVGGQSGAAHASLATVDGDQLAHNPWRRHLDVLDWHDQWPSARQLLFPAIRSFTDRPEQLLGRGGLGKKVRRACSHRPTKESCIGLDHKQNDLRQGLHLANGVDRVDDIHVGQMAVHQDHDGVHLLGQLHGLAARANRSHDLDVGFELQDSGDGIARLSVVVDDEYANIRHRCLVTPS